MHFFGLREFRHRFGTFWDTRQLDHTCLHIREATYVQSYGSQSFLRRQSSCSQSCLIIEPQSILTRPGPPVIAVFNCLTQHVVFTTVRFTSFPFIVHFCPTFTAIVLTPVLKCCGNFWPVYELPSILCFERLACALVQSLLRYLLHSSTFSYRILFSAGVHFLGALVDCGIMSTMISGQYLGVIHTVDVVKVV